MYSINALNLKNYINFIEIKTIMLSTLQKSQ